MPSKTPRRATQVLAIIAVSCAMLAGLTFILQRHAQQAESYPPYSSFRTLPEGTSILYDALAHTPGMTARRNTQPFGAARYHDAAILILGLQPVSLTGNGQWFAEMGDLANKGNRVIIGLSPRRYRFIQPERDQQVDALKFWGLRLAFVRETDFRDEEDGTLTGGWPMYFSQSPGWDVMRQEEGRAVVIERVVGKGSIVVAANPYLLSNAAMVDDRQTTFLSSLIGPMHQAIFDETHFGIEESGSIAALARRYRLQGLVLGLVITASLFIWKNASGFPPPLRGALQPARSLLGEDSSAAFLNLLRRNIRKEDILSTCVEAWRKMNARQTGSVLATAIDLAESGRKTPSQTYARIQQALSQPKGRLQPAPSGAPIQQTPSQAGPIRPEGVKPNQS